MTPEEINRERRALESQIERLLRDFEVRTGTYVYDVGWSEYNRIMESGLPLRMPGTLSISVEVPRQ